MSRTTKSHCTWCGKDGKLGPFMKPICYKLWEGKIFFLPNSSWRLKWTRPLPTSGSSPGCGSHQSLQILSSLHYPRKPWFSRWIASHRPPLFSVPLLWAWGIPWATGWLDECCFGKPSPGLCGSISVKWTCWYSKSHKPFPLTQHDASNRSGWVSCNKPHRKKASANLKPHSRSWFTINQVAGSRHWHLFHCRWYWIYRLAITMLILTKTEFQMKRPMAVYLYCSSKPRTC